MDEAIKQNYDDQRNELKELIEINKAHERLMKNKDFKKLILENYILKECARSVALSVDPKVPQEVRASCLGMAQAAGYLKHYLQGVYQMTSRAEDDLLALENHFQDYPTEE